MEKIWTPPPLLFVKILKTQIPPFLPLLCKGRGGGFQLCHNCMSNFKEKRKKISQFDILSFALTRVYLQFQWNLNYLYSVILRLCDRPLTALGRDFCLLKEESCLHFSFNTNTIKNHVKKISPTLWKRFGDSTNDRYFLRSNNGSRNL